MPYGSDAGTDFFDIGFFPDKVGGAAFQRRDAIFVVLTQDEHRNFRIHLPDTLEYFQAVESGHPEVQQYQIGRNTFESLPGFVAAVCRHHLITFFFQNFGHFLCGEAVVFGIK